MNREDKILAVQKAYDDLKEKHTPEIFLRLGVDQQAQMVQKALPTEPIYSTAKIKQLIFYNEKKK